MMQESLLYSILLVSGAGLLVFPSVVATLLSVNGCSIRLLVPGGKSGCRAFFSCGVVLFVIPGIAAASYPILRLAHMTICTSSCLHYVARLLIYRDRGTGLLVNSIEQYLDRYHGNDGNPVRVRSYRATELSDMSIHQAGPS